MTTAITYRPIGVIRSEHTDPAAVPIQPAYAEGCRGRVEVFAGFAGGLRDVEGFSHLFLLYDLHRAGPMRLTVKPYLEDVERGVFATRAPSRPNPIGLSIVTLVARRGNILDISGVDILDGTPLLDIKPYVGRFDCIRETRDGWQSRITEEMALRRGRRGHGTRSPDNESK